MRNLTLLTDLYQLTMMSGYCRAGVADQPAVFDLFFRPNSHISYALFAGLEQAAEYIKNIKFDGGDIDYLRSLGRFDEKFLERLRNLRFGCDVYSVREGTPIFPNEPIMIVKGSVFEAQFIETALLNIINHQTLIASKASRVALAAGTDKFVEFGLRRAQGPDAGIYGARASIIGGAAATSNVLAGQRFGLEVSGTMAHSFVLAFDSESAAFAAFADSYPDNCILIIDTYNTVKSGLPNAINVFDRLKAEGHKNYGVRIDSGDLAYLSKKARAMLDAAGHENASIFASGDLDENVIMQLKAQGARIDGWGVGTKMITSESMPSLGGVYKMSAFGSDLRPTMKLSDSAVKATTPCFKSLYRIYDGSGKAYADLIALHGEKLPAPPEPLTLTHPVERWKTSTLSDYTVRPLLEKVFDGGKCVYQFPTVSEIQDYAALEKSLFWEEHLRNTQPELYKVDLSDKLYEIKQQMLKI